MSDMALQTELLESAVMALPHDKLSVVRNAALSRVAASGFPTTKHEDWKYTNLSGAAALSNVWLTDMTAGSRRDVSAIIEEISTRIDAHWVTIYNGLVDPESFRRLGALAEFGINVSRLTDGIDEESIAIDEPMSAFNAALLLDGLHIRATKGASLDKPVGLLHLDDGSVALTQARVVIELESDAKLQLVECASSAGDAQQFSNGVTQATLSDSANLDVVRIQQRREQHLSVNRFTAQLKRDASLDFTSFDLGGGVVRNDVVADIVGEHASVMLRGLYLAGGRQHIDNHTRVDHRVGPAKSAEEYRGILNGRSRCVFNGKAVVHAGADGTDADQSNHNLLLADTAEIDTKPELEIYADDVKCSHGATVGQLDESALFYLQSRGLGLDQAKQILTSAFASAIADQVPLACCRDYLEAAMDRKLDALINEVAE